MRSEIPFFASLCLTACASLSAEVNAPLAADHLGQGYRLEQQGSPENSDELFIVLSFSGGGKRSAAFGYGVLTALRDLEITIDGRTTSLLAQVDAMAGVSGGSFPVAYYAVHGDAIFRDFDRDFLDVDFNAEIASIYLLPWRWDWMVNPKWGTNDEMARIYDTRMFRGARFASLEGNQRPFAIIQATDLATGVPFAFVQSQFDVICSDLGSYPVARAVAASNGFPVLFTPITLKNYRPDCAAPAPAWLDAARSDRDRLSRQRQQALLADRYLAGGYVHLIDGGAGDNLAMRGVLDYMARYQTDERSLLDIASSLAHAKHIVFVSVDGEAEQDKSISEVPIVGDVTRILSAVSSNTIDRYNFETLRLARTEMESLAGRLGEARCAEDPKSGGADGRILHLALVDQPGADTLKTIPTGLTINRSDVDALVSAGRNAVAADPDVAALKAAFGRPVPCPNEFHPGHHSERRAGPTQ